MENYINEQSVMSKLMIGIIFGTIPFSAILLITLNFILVYFILFAYN